MKYSHMRLLRRSHMICVKEEERSDIFGIAEFAGLEFAGLENDGRHFPVLQIPPPVFCWSVIFHSCKFQSPTYFCYQTRLSQHNTHTHIKRDHIHRRYTKCVVIFLNTVYVCESTALFLA